MTSERISFSLMLLLQKVSTSLILSYFSKPNRRVLRDYLGTYFSASYYRYKTFMKKNAFQQGTVAIPSFALLKVFKIKLF